MPVPVRNRGLYYEEPPSGTGGFMAEELEAKYHVTFFRLHDDATNNLVSTREPGLSESPGKGKKMASVQPSSSGAKAAAACRSSSVTASFSLHTSEELRQPLHQVPPPRSGHLLLPCAPRRSLILHGGLEVGPEGFLNDTWEYLIDEQRWVQLICRGVPGPARRSAVSGGGETDADQVVDDGMPPKAFGQSGTLFGGGRFLFVHGGVKSGDGGTAPAFQLDIERRLWTKINLTTPLPSMWGSVAQTLFIPVCEDGTTKRLPPSLSSKKAAAAAAAARKREQRRVEVVVVFGGMNDTEAYNTTYFLYLTTPPPSSGKLQYGEGEKRLLQILPSLGATVFPGRRRACSTVCRDFFFFVFGGRDGIYFYNDMWVLNAYTRQWIMVREETPLRFMREFFLRPYDKKPGARIMEYVENLLLMRRDSRRCRMPITIPHRCRHFNSSALWRTGAVMVTRGLDIFVLGGFTYDSRGMIETHKDVHVYNYMRHIWREAFVDVGCLPSSFPVGYFRKTGNKSFQKRECYGEAMKTELWHVNQEDNAEGSQNWKLIKNIVSILPEGRTMAAMCVDPVMPGFRFFLFGGRTEDEPSGELYDVRIHVDCAAPSDTTVVRNRGIQHGGDVTVEPSENTPHVSVQGTRLPSMKCFSISSDDASSTPREVPRWGERTLREQAGDWVRAVLLEESMLRRTMGLMLCPDDKVVRQEWLEDAHKAGAKMQKKADAIFPEAVRLVVTCAPPFVRRE
ncbi:hypothetical protein ECC02_006203 [Trypanosoma cruzi]|uniref:Uncharacterized protein n=1 Tax=Trypanosoma cruzi TaxID=5693 RepID=A0A7J6Y246_TRYCR|nr:hypothetical protein ECC02_006203 [Trypanosoma cruzi]